MKNDPRLQPWLELANELEAFDRFMRTGEGRRYFPRRVSSQGLEFDAGAAAAQRMRLIAGNRWTWYGWKRDGMEGEIGTELRTFRRWIAEAGGDGAYQETEAGREMLRRIESIERNLKRLVSSG